MTKLRGQFLFSSAGGTVRIYTRMLPSTSRIMSANCILLHHIADVIWRKHTDSGKAKV